jgi:hypothetical protein
VYFFSAKFSLPNLLTFPILGHIKFDSVSDMNMSGQRIQLHECNHEERPSCQQISFLIMLRLGSLSHDLEWHGHSLDRLCGLVGRVPGYRSSGPGSIPGATRFYEK